MESKPKVRFVPVYKRGKNHEGHIDGWVVHPDDRVVRELPKAKVSK